MRILLPLAVLLATDFLSAAPATALSSFSWRCARRLQASSPNTLWISGDCGAYRSDDAGRSWKQIYEAAGPFGSFKLVAIDDKRVWILELQSATPRGSVTRLSYSSDGVHWEDRKPLNVSVVHDLQFLSNTEGRMLATTNEDGAKRTRILSSSDGGEEWRAIESSVPDDSMSFYFNSDGVGWILSGSNDTTTLWTSTDDARTWTALWRAAGKPPPRVGWAVGGRTLWLMLPDRPIALAIDSQNAESPTGIRVAELPDNYNVIRSLSAVSSSVVLCTAADVRFGVSRSEALLRSDDGGRSWRVVWALERDPHRGMPELSAVFLCADDGYLLVSQLEKFMEPRFVLLQTDDGGKNWKVLHKSDGMSDWSP